MTRVNVGAMTGQKCNRIVRDLEAEVARLEAERDALRELLRCCLRRRDVTAAVRRAAGLDAHTNTDTEGGD